MADIDELQVESTPRRRPSMVWLVPLLAIAIALGVAWRNYADQGPLMSVSFTDASGVRAGETELRYRDIAVGLVESVSFSDALDKVILSIRLDQDIAPFVDEESVFWIVQPEVTTQGVSGLETVLSGVYLEGDWDGEAGAPQTSFEGLPGAPLLSGNEDGTAFVLQSPTGLPPASTPILYRGVEVGVMGRSDITADGSLVRAQAVIFAPYDGLVSSSTRFWDISGVSFNLGASGASLDFSSLASLIAGGVTFETLASGGQSFDDGDVFELFPNEETARQQFIIMGESGGIEFQVIFNQNLPGLSVGSAVNLGGVRIGEVVTIAGIADEERFGDGRVRLAATIRLVPSRIGFAAEDEDVEFIEFIDRQIQDGLRARLTTASLLTGGLSIELVQSKQVDTIGLDRDAEPFPQIPTTAPNVTDVGASAQGLLQRVEALPVEDVLTGVIEFLDAATRLVEGEDIQALPADLRATIEGIRAVAQSEEVAALPGEILSVTEGLTAVTEQVSALLTDAEDAALVDTLTSTIDSFGSVAESLPALVEQASGVLSEAEALALDELVAEMTDLVETANALLARDSLQTLPDEMNAAVVSLRTLIEGEDVAGLPGEVSELIADLDAAVGQVNSILVEVEEAALVTALTETLENFRVAADGLPALTEQASAVLSEVEELALQDLIERVTTLVDATTDLVDQDSTRALPAALNESLDELRATLAALQDGGLVENANETLASARDAAEAIADASESLPALSARLSTLANDASAALADYGRDGTVGRDLAAALRQIEAAAVSIDRLARQIARDPSSLLTGR
ncbi:MAG: MlaD family protein [Pseudomonadota bacterium]